MRPRLICFLCGSLILHLAGSTAHAWNSSGHMIIALVAWDHMDDATRTKAVELLRAHPRFHDHFQSFMPREVQRGSESEQGRWIFTHAATWPDLVRDAKGVVNREDVRLYSRPWWHFIDMPVYLNDDER